MKKAVFLPPTDPYMGNLVWKKSDFDDKKEKILSSLEKLRSFGYWASPFPEGDGITFKNNTDKTTDEMFEDFSKRFDWIKIELADSQNSNFELANLEGDRELQCIVIVPLEKIFIEESFTFGPFSFFCKRELDKTPYERLADFEMEYVQFNSTLMYKDLLRVNKSFHHNDYVINKCLSLAEHAMDIIRYQYSSFIKKEFTPNPAGQMKDGYFSIEIIPLGKTHLKPISLSGISRVISVSNNWLGPEIEGLSEDGVIYLSDIYSERVDNQLSKAVTSALRACRQSFYSIGNESQFLNLVFTLDGLTHPKSTWKGWKHRTYISALLSGGNVNKFGKILIRYDELYKIRNKLVHDGKEFYQLPDDPNKVCDEIYEFIKAIVVLIDKRRFSEFSELHTFAEAMLKTPEFIASYTSVIKAVDSAEGKTPQNPRW